MPIEKNSKEMLHFMKAGKYAMADYFPMLYKGSSKWCPFTHGKRADPACYSNNPAVHFLLDILRKYVLCFEFLEIDPYDYKDLFEEVNNLGACEKVHSHDIFLSMVKRINRIVFKSDNAIKAKLDQLTCEECIRLDEALNCFVNYEFYASVVMSVSAVESRMHYLLKKASPMLYKSQFEQATIGQIIRLYDKDAYKDAKYDRIKRLMPTKFRPLVELLNYLRVHSAHPKSVIITYKDAQSALNLSFQFLLDESVQIREAKVRHCRSR